MFREMRRSGQQLSKEATLQILKTGKTGVLAVIGDDGYPYSVPLNYVYEDGKIYFHCAKTGHKIDAIKQNNKVSFCIIDKDEVVKEKLTTNFRSVIIFGKAHILQTDDEIFRATEILGLKYCDDKQLVQEEIRQSMKSLCAVEIEIEHMTGKQSMNLMENTLNQ